MPPKKLRTTYGTTYGIQSSSTETEAEKLQREAEQQRQRIEAEAERQRKAEERQRKAEERQRRIEAEAEQQRRIEALLSEEEEKKIRYARTRFGVDERSVNNIDILKILELIEQYNIDEEKFFKMLKKISAFDDIPISVLIEQYYNPQSMPTGNEEIIFVFQAEYIIGLFTKDPKLNHEFIKCMDYLERNLNPSFEPNQKPTPDPKTFFQKFWEFCMGTQCTNQEEEEEEEDVSPPSRGLLPSVSTHKYNQEYSTTCVPMVLTRNIKKIIELLFYYTTEGKNLGDYRFCDSPCFKDIYKINNVFIMQYLKEYDKQCKYLFYLAMECFKKFRGTENIYQLFMYIYINFYLFMFIISLIDSYLRYIPCSDMGCRLTFDSILRNEKDLITEGGLCNQAIFSICKKLEEQLFSMSPSEIIGIETSEDAKSECYKKYKSLPPETRQKICDYTPLSYIPDDVISMLDELFETIKLRGQPNILTHYFQIYNHNGFWIWVKRDISKEDISKENISKQKLFPLIENTDGKLKLRSELLISKINPYQFPPLTDDGRINYGQLICDEIKVRVLSSVNRVIYASISCEIDKITEFKKEARKRSRATGLDTLRGDDTTHSLHELLLIIMGNPGNSFSFIIQNSWGETLCSIPITEELFVKFINNGTIKSIYYLMVNINEIIITGGIRKKTKKLRKKTKKNKKIKKKLRSNKRI